jgi:hypothetical protein
VSTVVRQELVAEPDIDIGTLTNNNTLVEALRAALGSGEHAFKMVPGLTAEVIEESAWLARMDRNGAPFRFAPGEFEKFITAKAPMGLGTTLDEMRRYLGGSDNPLRVRFELEVKKKPGNPVGRRDSPRNENGSFSSITNNVSNTGENGHSNGLSVSVVSAPVPVVQSQTNGDGHPVSEAAGISRSQNSSSPTPHNSGDATSGPKQPNRPRKSKTGNSVGYATRSLERHRPDLLARVEAGELSAHAAMLEAGLKKPTVIIPIDPEAAARLIVKHFKGDDLTALIRNLCDRADIPFPELIGSED